jgi:hypothetical protein
MASKSTAPYLFATADAAQSAETALMAQLSSTPDFLVTYLDETSFSISWTAPAENEDVADQVESILRGKTAPM